MTPDSRTTPCTHRHKTFSILCQLFHGGNHARWLHGCEHRDPGNAGYTAALVAIATGDIVLLGLSNSSAPAVRIYEARFAAAWARNQLYHVCRDTDCLGWDIRPSQRLFLMSDSWILEGLFD